MIKNLLRGREISAVPPQVFHPGDSSETVQAGKTLRRADDCGGGVQCLEGLWIGRYALQQVLLVEGGDGLVHVHLVETALVFLFCHQRLDGCRDDLGYQSWLGNGTSARIRPRPNCLFWQEILFSGNRQGMQCHHRAFQIDRCLVPYVLGEGGDMDVLSASYRDDTIAWYENNGSGIFTKLIITDDADGAYSVYAEDLDGDGDMDVL